jgi:hypothetical protein
MRSIDDPERWPVAGSAGPFDRDDVPGRLPGQVQFPPELMVQLPAVASGQARPGCGCPSILPSPGIVRAWSVSRGRFAARLHDARTRSLRTGPSGLCARSSRLPGRPAAGPPPCNRGAPLVECKTPAGREPQPHSALSPKKQTADDSLQACPSGQACSDRPFIPLEDQSRRHPPQCRLRSTY